MKKSPVITDDNILSSESCSCCSVAPCSCSWHGLQHARLLCPPRVCSNSCRLSWWCYPINSFSAAPFYFCLQSFPASGSFPMIWLFTSGGQCTRASTSASVLPMNIQSLFPLGLTGLISLLSKGLSRVFSGTTIRKHQFFSIQPSFWSDSHIHTDISMGKTLGKTLTVWSIVGKEMSLLFNTPKSKHLLISWLQSPFTVL